jgi:hypothetical protein
LGCTKGTEKTVDARGKWEMEVWGEEVTLLRNEASLT